MRFQPDTTLLALIDRWTGSEVAVRILATREDLLIGTFIGELQRQSNEKRPALFWPLETGHVSAAEQPGIYMHTDSFAAHRIHEGGFVVEFEQAGVTTNIRHLGK